ncbi:uncharacterized protein LOC141691660 [Apium graveolens]|uniref:uncharacterized protein LOC141691660 n=1 Tax=Apium graveolens TaxID=4045 RepID=UPI003D78F3C0
MSIFPNSSNSTTEHHSSREETLVRTVNVWEVGSVHSNGRLQVEVIKGVLEPSNLCSHKITDIMYERLEPTGFTWKKVSAGTKQFYFEEFKKWFVWRQEDNLVYRAWFKSASRRYSTICCEARTLWENNSKPKNKIGNDVWLSWVEYWKTPEFQKKSAIQKNNRRSGADKAHPTHTSGSASSRVHTARLKKKYNRDPTSFEVYEHIHTRKNDKKTYIDEKSQKVYENYVNLCELLTQESQPIDPNKVFYQAVGGHNQKNIVYGLGSSQNLFYAPGSSSNAASIHFSSKHNTQEDYQKLQAELQVEVANYAGSNRTTGTGSL